VRSFLLLLRGPVSPRSEWFFPNETPSIPELERGKEDTEAMLLQESDNVRRRGAQRPVL
jgi:hypothetical protein